MLICCLLALVAPLHVAMSCLDGIWHVSNPFCPNLTQPKFDVVVRSTSSTGFSVDVDPSRWSHFHSYSFSLSDAATLTYSGRTNRLVPIGNLSLILSQKCQIHSNSTFALANRTFFGAVAAGRGVVSVVDDGTVCNLAVEKELKYDGWRFSLSILIGIATMFVALQSTYGWQKDDVMRLLSIPINNPGEECEEVEAKPVDAPDEFDSDDGF
jgi:hypothetical protein